MKKVFSFLMAFMFIGATLMAQDSTQASATSRKKGPNDNHGNYIDLGVSGISDQFAVSLGWAHLIGVGKGQQRLKIGFGARFTSYFSNNQYYTTAAPEYASTPADIDTLSLAYSQFNPFNVDFHIQYSVLKKMDLGFNIDVIGVTLGSKREASVISSSYDAGQNTTVYGKPTAFNLLLVGNRDKGSLNSEFYARYWISPKFALKVAYTYMFTEYKTYVDLSFNNGAVEVDRFRLKSGLATIAVSWRPFIK